jgi:uncharacterized protein
MSAAQRRPTRNAATTSRGAAQPLGERELDELQQLLDSVSAPLEPLDVSMLDGFLCGVLVQPVALPVNRWMQYVTDIEGRALPADFVPVRLHALVERRHAELADAIERRQWFDPWIFELSEDAPSAPRDEDDAAPAGMEAVYPWVAGFATALELFPQLMRLDAQALSEPLALLYRHLAREDLEDADELLAEIDSLEPPADLAEAVEGLVRATLLRADVTRPVAPKARRAPARGAQRRR